MSLDPGAAEATERGAAEGTAPNRVLIVHGAAGIRQALVRGLSYERHDITETASARAALDCVAATPFDLVLLDMALPEVSGLQLLRLLKGDSRTCDLPVIMIAGVDESDGVVDCLEAGADDYLSQPLHPVLLRVRVSAALEKKRLRDTETALREAIASSRVSHEKLIQRMLATAKLEFAQLQETIKALRHQLDTTTAAAKASVETARSSAAAELRQLRATCRALREKLDAATSGQDRDPPSDWPQRRTNDGR